ncbi:MAG TPA: hypothetical protein VNI20_12185 [Fimbriimonadaceae bacterium]|nr:hypothetical protein [Fimbriimonadaceae bacterium]
MTEDTNLLHVRIDTSGDLVVSRNDGAVVMRVDKTDGPESISAARRWGATIDDLYLTIEEGGETTTFSEFRTEKEFVTLLAWIGDWKPSIYQEWESRLFPAQLGTDLDVVLWERENGKGSTEFHAT